MTLPGRGLARACQGFRWPALALSSAGRRTPRALTGRPWPRGRSYAGAFPRALPSPGLGKKEGRQSRDAQRQSEATFTLYAGFFFARLEARTRGRAEPGRERGRLVIFKAGQLLSSGLARFPDGRCTAVIDRQGLRLGVAALGRVGGQASPAKVAKGVSLAKHPDLAADDLGRGLHSHGISSLYSAFLGHNPGDFREGFFAHAHGVIKPLLKVDIALVQLRPKPGSGPQVGRAGHNAKDAGQPRHTRLIGPNAAAAGPGQSRQTQRTYSGYGWAASQTRSDQRDCSGRSSSRCST